MVTVSHPIYDLSLRDVDLDCDLGKCSLLCITDMGPDLSTGSGPPYTCTGEFNLVTRW